MPYKNQNYMTNYLIKEEVDKLQKDYVDPNQQEASEEKLYYSLTSYGDGQGTEQLATGIVEILAKEKDYISVKVTENSVEGFVGNTYYLQPDAVADTQTLYQLYTDNELKNSTGMYVSITSIEEENQKENNVA